jgi:hypothetical protein
LLPRLAAAAGADDDLGGQHLHCRGERRLVDPGEQPVGGTAAKVAQRLADRGQRRVDDAAGVHVVVAGHRHVRRDPHARLLQLAQRADGHLVVRAHHGLRQRLAAEQGPGGRDAAVLGEVTVDDLGDAAARAGRDGLLECQPPFGGVRCVLRAGEEAEPVAAVLLDQVPGDRGHAAGVVTEEDVHRGLVTAPGDDDDGYLGGQRPQFVVIEDFLGDEQAVDLAGERAHPLREQLAAAAEGQQQRVLGPAQHRLGRVHDVVDEQQAASLDVDLVGAPLEAHQPDDVLPPPGEAARRRVGDEAERLDDGEHPLARVRVHQVRPAQHPRHGRDGHPGHLGDVIDRRHADPLDMIRNRLMMTALTLPLTW